MNTETFIKNYQELSNRLQELKFFDRQDFSDLSLEDARLMAYAHSALFKATLMIATHFMPPCEGFTVLSNDLKDNKFIEVVTNLESLAKALEAPEAQVSYGFLAALIKFSIYHPEHVNLFQPIYEFLMSAYPEKNDELTPIDAINQASEFIKSLRDKNPKEEK